MRKISDYLPFYLVISIAIGIYLNHKIIVIKFETFQVFGAIIVLIILLFLSKKNINNQLFFPLLILSFIGIGFASAHIHNPQNFCNYYQYQELEDQPLTIQIKERIKSNKLYHKYIGKIHKVNDKITRGTLLINIDRKDSETLEIDQLLLVKPIFNPIPTPLNPYKFDYNDYLKKRYVYQQIFLKKDEFKIIKKNSYSLAGISDKIRISIEKSLDKHPFSTNVINIIKALLLGQRKEVSKEILHHYTNAGVIHILAISGLHLGILLVFLNFILKPLSFFKYGLFIKIFIVLLLLWSFAFISGLSPSVNRSATMFSFICIAELFNKKTISEYSIISSMFVLLLLKPMYLFSVGFQLSYLALFGIIWISPLLFSLWSPNYFFVKKFWEFTVISVSAQIGVLPLSLYYFHQFPGLFLVSNLTIIPFLGAILILGIFVILLALFDTLPKNLVLFYDCILIKMNQFIKWVASFDQFIIKEIALNQFQTVVWYLIIIGCVSICYKFSKKQFVFTLSCIITLQVSFICNKKVMHEKDAIIIFHQRKKTIIGRQKGKQLTIYQNKNSSSDLSYLLSPIKQHENLNISFKERIPNILKHKESILLVLKDDEFSLIERLNEKVIILLSNSPKINLDRILKNNTPRVVIADGSNYKSYINRWKKTCSKQKISFYVTEQNGAFIIR